VRRVKDMNPPNQSELFIPYRYHAVFTNSPLPMLPADKAPPGARNHRAGHRRPEERAAGALPPSFHAKATTGTIHAQLITVPGRLARSVRRLTLHLPTAWHWQQQWEQLATAANRPPLAP
jgi:hypothetical protein